MLFGAGLVAMRGLSFLEGGWFLDIVVRVRVCTSVKLAGGCWDQIGSLSVPGASCGGA